MSNSITKTRKLVEIGMLGAIATVLMLFEFPIPFIAPPFYEMDLSEVPVLVGAFALGPMAGATIELIKILINLMINGTATAFVGEIGNYIIGCSFIIPAALIYKKRKSKKHALIGMIVGTLVMTIFGCFLNAYVLLPTYAAAFGMPIDVIVGMGTAINANINSVMTFVIIAVAPFNILKGVVVSVVTMLIYKHISPILKGNR
ncbi:MAG: ECF transporter S component [Lachnospiraceae bacterium]|nr:ECF transporter S component [Lachnospiraceae bacterium]